jgi:hypothetical protein
MAKRPKARTRTRTGVPSLKAEERRLLAIFRRRAKQRIEEAVDRVMRRYIKRALKPGGAEILMHVVDRLVPAAPRVIIIKKG